MMQGDTAQSVSFLVRFRPSGPWVLSAIAPDKDPRTREREIETRTFLPHQEGEMGRWINERQDTYNLYFSVNPTRRQVNKKLKKTDIAEMVCLHVDIDPRADFDTGTERLRIKSLLLAYAPHPSIIVDSGGGYQAYWLLEKPIELDGTEGCAQDAECFNRQLEIQLGGDHCHNVDRIMRIPGTINVPDEKKRQKGRKRAMAETVWMDFALRYPLTAFTKAPAIQETQEPGLAAQGVEISGNLPRVTLVELPPSVRQETRDLIAHGHDPERYPSRSEAVFRVACELVRADLDNDTIAAILLDPDYAISTSVREQRRPDRYVARQIRRAREEVDSPWLRALNDKHAVVSDDGGGQCVVITEIADDALGGRPRLTKQAFTNFRNRYLNQTVQVGYDKKGNPITDTVGSWWLKHPRRRQYDTITFAPGREINGAYNLWRGFACDAVPGSCNLFLEHTYRNICSGNDEYFAYMINWMARAVQKPACPGEVAIVLRGRMGTGKGTFVKGFGSLWGRHYLHVSDSKHVVGNFNAHLRDCLVLFADEAFYAGDKKHEAVLKQLVTEELLVIEAKGVDAGISPNFLHILMASNKDWVVPAGTDERRFFVLDVADSEMQDTRYFAKVKEELDSGGREALLHMLLSRDITNFEVRAFPHTQALQEQKLLSYGPMEDWWFAKLTEGRVFPGQDRWVPQMELEDLQRDFFDAMERRRMHAVSEIRLAKFLKSALPIGWPRRRQMWNKGRTKRVSYYELPDLTQCRAHWDRYFGGPFGWNDYYEEPGFNLDEAPAQQEAF